MPTNQPNKYPITLTFTELQDVVAGLKEHRDRQYVSGDVESYVKYSWMIKDTEANLVNRARLAELIFRLSGEVLTEDPTYAETLAEAKRQKAELEALEAAEAALDA